MVSDTSIVITTEIDRYIVMDAHIVIDTSKVITTHLYTESEQTVRRVACAAQSCTARAFQI